MSSRNEQPAMCGRLDYLLTLTWLVLLKHGIDWLLARVFFHRPWSVLNYFLPSAIARDQATASDDTLFFLALLVTSVPFVWLAAVLTARRLCDVGWPRWLVALLFIPVLNLILVLMLIVVPPHRKPEAPVFPGAFDYLFDSVLPKSSVGSAGIAVMITAALCVGITFLSAELYRLYGWTLFVGLPFIMGFASVLFYSLGSRQTLSKCLFVAVVSLIAGGIALLACGFEGAICLLMAAPLAIPVAMLGGFVGYSLQELFHDADRGAERWIGVLLALPMSVSIEHAAAPEPPLLQVSSDIEIDAPIDDVWQNVVSFSDLPDEREWIFHLGLAYPVRAELDRCGVGATRRCIFNTGAFIEPIEVWDEPHRLAFTVTHSPHPMEEWTPYSAIHPPHLEGFLQSRRGQFELLEMPDGKVKIIGTTWYQHTMWPAGYWQLWSDWIIHRIHMRVLTHIKNLSEEAKERTRAAEMRYRF